MAGLTSAPKPASGQSAWPGYPNNTAISVTSGGYVGIGTASPSARLDVFSGGDNTNVKFEGATGKFVLWPYYNYAGNNWGSFLCSVNPAETAYTPLTLIGSTLTLGTNGGSINIFGGNVGIGTTNPRYKLAVNGTIGAKQVIRGQTASGCGPAARRHGAADGTS